MSVTQGRGVVTIIGAQHARSQPRGSAGEVVVGVLANRRLKELLSFHIEVCLVGVVCRGRGGKLHPSEH